MPGPQGYHGASIRTYAFPATTARYFRIELDAAGLTPAAVIHGGPLVPASNYVVTEAIFYTDARVSRWEDKGAFGSLMDVYDVVPTPSAPPSAEINPKDVIDLTSRMRPDGTARLGCSGRTLDRVAHGLFAYRRAQSTLRPCRQRL